MGRVIKFRGWDTVKKIMYSAEEMGADELTLNPDGRGFVNVNSCSPKLSLYCPHIIPLESTGLADKFADELFQADLGKDLRGNLYEIVWMDREAGWGAKNLSDTGEHPECNPCRISYGWLKMQRFEKVGNVYENSYLLGGD
jgi:hypothetical protein